MAILNFIVVIAMLFQYILQSYVILKFRLPHVPQMHLILLLEPLPHIHVRQKFHPVPQVHHVHVTSLPWSPSPPASQALLFIECNLR